MTKFIDLTGRKFGRWTVIKRAENTKNGSVQWLCKCECGTERIHTTGYLNSGMTKSCGCYKKEIHTKHGFTKCGKNTERLYHIWCCMRQRCLNPNNKRYINYGGRGVTICKDWDNYAVFRDWALNNGYEDGLTIERINVDGNYEPLNCTWITNAKQQTNTTRSVKYLGVCEAEWERVLGLSRWTIKEYRRSKKTTLEQSVKHFQELGGGGSYG